MVYHSHLVVCLQANLIIQEAKLDKAMADLNAAQAQLDEKQKELDIVQAKFDAAMAEKQVRLIRSIGYHDIA